MSQINQPAVFVDRDGTLIHEVNYLSNPDQVVMFEDVPASLRAIKQAGYRLIVITNQSGIARKYFSEEVVGEVFHKMNDLLRPYGVQLDDQFFCPHHLDGLPPLNIECDCRKPKPGMILQSQEKYQSDLSRSFMLGDKLCDVELARNLGMQGILLETGHGKEQRDKVKEKLPEVPICPNFQSATDYLLSRS